MRPNAAPRKFFISSTSTSLGGCRSAVARQLQACGFDVRVQRPYPTNIGNGNDLKADIEDADAVICLVGFEYGTPFPAQGVPKDMEAPEGYSWTQWEYWYARQIALRDDKPLWIFIQEKDASVSLPEPEQTAGEAERQLTFRGEVERQLAFRKDVEHRETASFPGQFFRYFKEANELAWQIARLVESSLAPAFWQKVRDDYRRETVREWRATYPETYSGKPPSPPIEGRDGRQRPFIETQSFGVLKPDRPEKAHHQLKFLTPAAFLAGRDSEREAEAAKGASWPTLHRAELIEALCGSARPAPLGKTGVDLPVRRRLFFIAGGGVGKSTNLRWLEAELNKREAPKSAGQTSKPDRAPLAVWIEADELADELAEKRAFSIIERLSHAIARKAGIAALDEEKWKHDAIKTGLRKDRDSGRLTLIVDSLDHLGPAKTAPPFVLETETADWTPCAVVMAGRPHALHGWEDEKQYNVVDASRWRFVQPEEFEEHEAKAYLDVPGEPSRYDAVEATLGGLAKVPRVLEYVRPLSSEQIANCRTSADIYLQAIDHLIDRAMREGGARARLRDAGYARDLLAAMAFDGVFWRRAWTAGVSPPYSVKIDPDAQGKLRDRMLKAEYDNVDMRNDLVQLGAFATIVGNGIVSAGAVEAGPPKSFVWSNRTVRDFLAAYWLARHANADDAERMCFHIFRPEDDDSDYFYEFNVFLAEMPDDGRSNSRWVDAASAWYSFDRERTWASEMIYRSWPTMHAIAGLPLDDWWNNSYAKVSNQADRIVRFSFVPDAYVEARQVLAQFQKGFQAVLDGRDGIACQEAAREMVAAESWRRVPRTDSFIMGSPEDAQGFPLKTAKYWKSMLGKVQAGVMTAAEAASVCTKASWFLGAAGLRLKEHDIAWLTRVLKPLQDGDRVSNPRAASFLTAYDEIERRWRRKDETPQEGHAPQTVEAFAMHRYPVLHRWYALFAPAHKTVVTEYLAKVPSDDKDKREIPHPPDDHPVIYVSWHDAWAFCQWVRWTDPDTHTRYGLRLPHEIEWEYAARWAPNASGPPRDIMSGYPYWWGTTFYDSEDGIEESISKKEAHAQGAPGATRAPADADANGLGFHDMLGNVWEWCANIYDPGEKKTLRDRVEIHYSRNYPEGPPPANPQRAMRGGLWYYLNLLSTVSNRFRLSGEDRDYKTGFRVVREEIAGLDSGPRRQR